MGVEQNHTSRRFTSTDRTVLGIGWAALTAGILLLTLAHGAVAAAIGIFLIGLCGIALAALVFLLVGESEDRHYRKEAL